MRGTQSRNTPSQRDDHPLNSTNESGPNDDVTTSFIYERDTRTTSAVSVISDKASQRHTDSALDRVEAYVRRYVVLPEAAYTAVALWVAHCWFIDAADASPLLYIKSPTRQSGKTRLLETLKELVPNPWLTMRTTTAALVRKLDADKPILLLDETDQVFRGNGEYVSALTAILNAGYRRGQTATICVKDGKDWSTDEYDCFGPKALAGIEEGLPDTILDRSIQISLIRQTAGQKAERFRFREAERAAAPIREELQALSADKDIVAELRNATPDLPDELSDRQMDIWEPLFAIADLFGWEDRARAAAIDLTRKMLSQDGDLKLALLQDLLTLFHAKKADWLPSTRIVQHLNHDHELQWASHNRGQGLTVHQMGELLKVFSIRSVRQRDHNGEQLRGYKRADLEKAAKPYHIYAGIRMAFVR